MRPCSYRDYLVIQLHPGPATICHPPAVLLHQSAGMFVFLEFAWPAVAAKSSLGPCGFHLWFGKHNMFKRYWCEKESTKNCLDIQNIWLEWAIYFSISMRQFSEDKGQLTSFHNFQKVQVKDSECISSQPAMNFCSSTWSHLWVIFPCSFASVLPLYT